jgi:hypothetical protein
VAIAKNAQVFPCPELVEGAKKGKIVAKKSKKIKIYGKYSKIIKNFKKSCNHLSVLLLWTFFYSPHVS